MASVEHKINIMLSGTIYHVASIGINASKQEIFYSPKSTNYDLAWDLNMNKPAGTLDHFSFHKNGTINATFKAINRDQKQKTKLPLRYIMGRFQGSFPSEPYQVRHLIIDSIYQVNNEWALEESSDICNFDCFIKNQHQFSLILTLMPTSSPSLDILHSEGFPDILICEKYLEIFAWSNWKVVVYATPTILPIVNLQGPFYALSFKQDNKQFLNRQIVTPPTPLAYKHLSSL